MVVDRVEWHKSALVVCHAFWRESQSAERLNYAGDVAPPICHRETQCGRAKYGIHRLFQLRSEARSRGGWPFRSPTRSPELAQQFPCELKRTTTPDSQQPGMGPASNGSAGPRGQCVTCWAGCPFGPSDCSWITLYSSGTGRARWARPAVCGMQVH